MRKTLVLILLALVMVTALMFPALAAGGTASVSPTTGKSGETVTLTVSLSGFEQATTVGVKIVSSDMEFVSGEWALTGGLLANVSANGNAAWQAQSATNVNGNALKMTFKLPAYDGTLRYSAQFQVDVKKGATSLYNQTITGTVNIKNPAESVSLNKTTLSLDLSGTKTGALTATVNPSYSTDTVTWSSSNTSVATVSNGTVTALKAGTATIKATAGGKSASCTVTVTCGHKNAVETKAKKATCQATGNNAYWTCGDCGQVLKANKTTQTTVAAETLAKVSHSGGTTTCTAKAICSMCGNPYGSTKAHNYAAAWKSDATSHWHVCTTCNTQKGSQAAHSFSWVVDKAATEDATGLKHEKCATCGYKRNENTVIPKLDHAHGDIKHHAAVKATCVKAGTLEYWTCGKAKCAGKYYADANCQVELNSITQAINANNHTGKTEVKGKVEATCAKEGASGDTICVDCKAVIKKSAIVPATGKHTPKDGYLKDVTSHWQVCSVCNQVVDKKAAHTFEWVIDKKATEEETGLKHEVCSVCKVEQSKQTVIDKLPHEPVKVEAREATCEITGAKEHFYCANCERYYASNDGVIGDIIEKDTVITPALGHTFGTEWVGGEEGHWHVCATCGGKSEVEEHVAEVIGAVEATEEKEGYTGDSVCSVCKQEISKGETIPVIGQEPEATEPADTQTEKKDNDGVIIAVVILVVVLGAGGAVLLVKKSKKK